MQVAVSFKVPKELKDRMKTIPVRWSAVVREAIEREIARHERQEAVRGLLKLAEQAPSVPPGTVAKALREMREEA